ncbi:MAG: hypothetical protein ACRDYV_22575, partial [Acidimicrobiia bacterium]
MSEVPEEVMRLAGLRGEARQQRDFAEADRLRDEIVARGWYVLDRPDGFELKPVPRRRPVSIVADVHSWPGDYERLFASLTRQPLPDGGFEVIEVVPTIGFGGDCNAALAQADADVVVFVDTSLEATGDVLGTLLVALEDESVAVAG